MSKQPRRRIGAVTLILIAVGLGLLIKNVKLGLIIGLGMGLLAGGLISSKHND
ncbi:MAG: hypothetical protein NTY72_01890 [Bacteroidetes bacterium]|jgi:hypothetical protein|nr:hypothetical protein [Bacteroidota bacterium]MCX6338057.1 hypothetical protein [Bacteroidota bacterium]